ncbi:CHASE domain-containing protein [Ruegeria marina]|uniref:Sensor domain CHASE1-containing protein n=1 Tax=Ruegeria marina TaxID=639004 RepID=A0A1G6S3S7_9RHOB|nr:CHASE domain-containing protein [Ruegeria marina]SDD11351.1 sensor domain CHASE1-containing protein [Ruegeria marina]
MTATIFYSVLKPLLIRKWLPVVALAVSGVCLSFILFLYASDAERQRLIAKFEITANQPILAINNRIQAILATVESLVAYYESSEHVTRREFQVFTSFILSRNRDIQALEWLPNVLAEERDIYELSARLDGLPEFQIRERTFDGRLAPAALRSEYFPVYYVEPLAGNEGALGFDVMSETTRSAALVRARQTSQLVVSDPVSLVQSSNGEHGILMVAPVFERGQSGKTPGQVEKQFLGFVLAVVQIPELIGTAVSPWTDTPAFGGIYVFANLDGEGQELVFARQASPAAQPAVVDAISRPFVSELIWVADREWEVVIKPPPRWPTPRDLWLPWSLLFTGLGLTAVASAIYRMRLRGIMQLEELASSLQAKNQRLEVVSAALAKYLPRQLWNAEFVGNYGRSIGAKRKLLTIFFGDIVGFTRLSTEMRPDELMFILNDFFSEISSIGLRHGATLDKYVGDAVVMFFGDPTSNGEHQDAVSCVTMAIEMQHRMHGLRAKWRGLGYTQPFHMRIGIHSGACDVGNFGSDERMAYTIVGLEVNIAARIEKFGAPDGVTITGETLELVKDQFECEPHKKISLKGVERDVELFSVIMGSDAGLMHKERLKNPPLLA